MTVTLVPVPAAASTSDPGFYALVQSVKTGLLSSSVKCLFVEVLAGSVGRGERVEVVRQDGSVITLVARELRSGLGQIVLDLADPHPAKSDVDGAALVRTPGLEAPPLQGDGGAGVDRLIEAVRAARAHGFPAEWAKPARPLGPPTPEDVCAQFRMLPDEAVVLLVQKRVRDATTSHDNPFTIMPDVEHAAMLLDAIGLSEDGDRMLLAASAAVQGHKASAALRATATGAAIGMLSTEAISASALGIGRRAGWALGIEMGDAFAKSFQSSVAAGGEVVEAALLEAGRATGVALCKRCRDVAQLTLGKSTWTASPEFHCPRCNHKIDHPFLVVPADAAQLQEALRSQLRAERT